MFYSTKSVLRLFCCIALSMCLALPSTAQVDATKRRQAKKIAKKGDKYFKQANYYQAITYYEQALAADSMNLKSLVRGGISSLTLFSNKRSLDYLSKAYELNPYRYNDIDYFLGLAYQVNLKFDEAIRHIETYRARFRAGTEERKELDGLLKELRVGKKYYTDPADYYSENLGKSINTPYSDHSPVMTRDGKNLIFTSTRTEQIKGKDVTNSGDSYEKVYSATQFFDGSWGKAKLLQEVNSLGLHTATIQLFEDDSKLLVYNSAKLGSILVAEKKDNVWTKPVPFSKYTDTQEYESNGYITGRGTAMYFASSRDSKQGDLDLFVIYKDHNGEWSEPRRLPDYINSTEDEDSPFVSPDGLTLYFSSRGHESMGGFDVFKTTYNPAARLWSKPVNMGYPINSPKDDIFFVTNDSTQVSFISSDRLGSIGMEDIFKIKPLEDVLVRGSVTDKKTGKILPDYDITFASIRTRDLGAITTTGPNGIYGASVRCRHTYKLNVLDGEGQIVHSEDYSVPMTTKENLVLIKDIEIGAPVVKKKKVLNQLAIDNLNLVKISYQEYDSLFINGSVLDGASPVVGASVRLRPESSSLTSHYTTTDAQGNYQFGFVPGKKEDYVVEILKESYVFNTIAIVYVPRSFLKVESRNQRNKNVNQVQLRNRLVKVEKGANWTFGGIYFDNNGSTLRSESIIELTKLYKLLNEHPAMTLQISGYTDNSGNSTDNRIISQKCAQAVINFLIDKGIAANRLASRGYGEASPIVSNDIELNGRDVNRRVEIKIVNK